MDEHAVVAAPVVEKPSKRTFFSYTLGGIGRDMTYSIYANFIITFILFTKGLSDYQFGVISGIIIACRVWDAINDPIMGSIIENTHTRWGKFKPWILIGAISTAIVLVILFGINVTGWGFVILFGFMAFLWSICFTMNDISYWSMLPSLTSDPNERSKLTAVANLCAGIGGVMVIAATPVLTAGNLTIGGSAVTAYAVIAVIIAVVFLACTCLTVFGVQEKKAAPKGESVGLKKLVRILKGNDQLIWTAVGMLLYNLGATMVTAFGAIYIYFEFSYNGTLVLLLTVAFALGAVFVNLFYPILAKKINRKHQQTIFITTTIAGYAFILLVSLVMGGLPDAAKLALICLGVVCLSFGQSMYYMMLTINIANSVEYNEWLTGERNEGIIFSLRPFTVKLGSALQQLVIMVVYIIAGVTKVSNGISELEQDVSRGLITEEVKKSEIAKLLSGVKESQKIILSICMTVIPILLMTAAYIITKKKFKIDEAFYQKILNDINDRKAAASAKAETAQESVSE